MIQLTTNGVIKGILLEVVTQDRGYGNGRSLHVIW